MKNEPKSWHLSVLLKRQSEAILQIFNSSLPGLGSYATGLVNNANYLQKNTDCLNVALSDLLGVPATGLG